MLSAKSRSDDEAIISARLSAFSSVTVSHESPPGHQNVTNDTNSVHVFFVAFSVSNR